MSLIQEQVSLFYVLGYPWWYTERKFFSWYWIWSDQPTDQPPSRWLDKHSHRDTRTPMSIIGKKSKTIFNFWLMLEKRGLVSNFCLRKIAKVRPFCELLGADVYINTKNSLDNPGSNETMQKVLASIVLLWRIFQKKIWGSKIWISAFFIRFGWNLLWGIKLGKEQHKGPDQTPVKVPKTFILFY